MAPLGPDIAGPELVAAVANAGDLVSSEPLIENNMIKLAKDGLQYFCVFPAIAQVDLEINLTSSSGLESPHYLRELIRKTRSLTDKPFGVGVVLAFPHEKNIQVILDEKVAVLQVYWGECSEELVLKAHQSGVKVVPQSAEHGSKVGSLDKANKAIYAGVDAIIVQGREAGGHVISQDALISLLPKVADLVGDRDIPVIAPVESRAHPTYKRKLVEFDRTEYTDVFGRARWPGAPHRVLYTPFFNDWKSLPLIRMKQISLSSEIEIRRLAGTVPNVTATGDIEAW
ncbi:Aldolase-type TIM barrel family protein [Prunus dulcis]|uniref:Aldolase-type TIM barrel family protein n=1 Tax=Prunus dulcis TaxID=3755 RepID=A0A4Y1RZI7_PRUDU|nr:Aldolase-type TIM barrel family protein [Prunus dulcis]